MKISKELLEKADHTVISLMGIPHDENSSFMRGPAEAPGHIRAALHSTSTCLWTETDVNLAEEGIFCDMGDMVFSSGKDAFASIEASVSLLLEKRAAPILLGGDHAVTYPIIRAFSKKYSKLNVLHFDAHPDLYDELDGNRLSHACPFARSMEENLIGRLVQVGIRLVNGHQREQAERFGVEMVRMHDFNMDFIDSLASPLYISFDMDALDPAFAPGVSHHEPGGLSTRQVFDIIHGIDAGIVGVDIVELNPRRDIMGITAVAAAKVLKESMGKIVLQNK